MSAWASPARPATVRTRPTPRNDTCKQCHDVKALVEKTKDVKPANPHMSPHYRDELECTNCHIMHGETENFCDQCHQFGYKVP